MGQSHEEGLLSVCPWGHGAAFGTGDPRRGQGGDSRYPDWPAPGEGGPTRLVFWVFYRALSCSVRSIFSLKVQGSVPRPPGSPR